MALGEIETTRQVKALLFVYVIARVKLTLQLKRLVLRVGFPLLAMGLVSNWLLLLLLLLLWLMLLGVVLLLLTLGHRRG